VVSNCLFIQVHANKDRREVGINLKGINMHQSSAYL
jgi:hypothetical protein